MGDEDKEMVFILVSTLTFMEVCYFLTYSAFYLLNHFVGYHV